MKNLKKLNLTVKDLLAAQPPTLEDYAEQILALVDKTAAHYLETANLCARAYDAYKGDVKRLLELLKMEKSKFYKLVAVGRATHLHEPAVIRSLPDSGSTIELLKRFSESELNDLIDQGKLTPNLTREEAQELIRERAAKKKPSKLPIPDDPNAPKKQVVPKVPEIADGWEMAVFIPPLDKSVAGDVQALVDQLIRSHGAKLAKPMDPETKHLNKRLEWMRNRVRQIGHERRQQILKARYGRRLRQIKEDHRSKCVPPEEYAVLHWYGENELRQVLEVCGREDDYDPLWECSETEVKPPKALKN